MKKLIATLLLTALFVQAHASDGDLPIVERVFYPQDMLLSKITQGFHVPDAGGFCFVEEVWPNRSWIDRSKMSVQACTQGRYWTEKAAVCYNYDTGEEEAEYETRIACTGSNNRKWFAGHAAHDLAPVDKTIDVEIVAIAAGIVQDVGYDALTWGHYIITKHHFRGEGYLCALNAHMKYKPNVVKNDPVTGGSTVLGIVGNTGASGGTHNHFAIKACPEIVGQDFGIGNFRGYLGFQPLRATAEEYHSPITFLAARGAENVPQATTYVQSFSIGWNRIPYRVSGAAGEAMYLAYGTRLYTFAQAWTLGLIHADVMRTFQDGWVIYDLLSASLADLQGGWIYVTQPVVLLHLQGAIDEEVFAIGDTVYPTSTFNFRASLGGPIKRKLKPAEDLCLVKAGPFYSLDPSFSAFHWYQLDCGDGYYGFAIDKNLAKSPTEWTDGPLWTPIVEFSLADDFRFLSEGIAMVDTEICVEPGCKTLHGDYGDDIGGFGCLFCDDPDFDPEDGGISRNEQLPSNVGVVTRGNGLEVQWVTGYGPLDIYRRYSDEANSVLVHGTIGTGGDDSWLDQTVFVGQRYCYHFQQVGQSTSEVCGTYYGGATPGVSYITLEQVAPGKVRVTWSNDVDDGLMKFETMSPDEDGNGDGWAYWASHGTANVGAGQWYHQVLYPAGNTICVRAKRYFSPSAISNYSEHVCLYPWEEYVTTDPSVQSQSPAEEETSVESNAGTTVAEATTANDDYTHLSLNGDASGYGVTVGNFTPAAAMAGSFTLEAMIRPGDLYLPDPMIMGYHDTARGPWTMFCRDGACMVRIHRPGGYGELYATVPASRMHLDAWQRLTAVFTGSELAIYHDCLEVDRATWTGGNLPVHPNTPLAVGARLDGVGTFDGELDEVRVYNRALTADEITGHCGDTPASGEVVYYPLDGDGVDHSGNGHHLTFPADSSWSEAKAQ